MKKLELIESLRVGHPQIDSEHNALIDRANALIDAIAADDRDEFLKLIPEYFDKVSEHFTNEIQVLRELGFPNVDGHAEFHERALIDLADLQRQFEAGAPLVSLEIIHQKTTDLLVHDIVREDLEFKSFLQELRNQGKLL